MRLLTEYGYGTGVVLAGVAVFLEAAQRGLRQSVGGKVTLELSVAEMDVIAGALEVYLAGLSESPSPVPVEPAPEAPRALRLVSQASR